MVRCKKWYAFKRFLIVFNVFRAFSDVRFVFKPPPADPIFFRATSSFFQFLRPPPPPRRGPPLPPSRRCRRGPPSRRRRPQKSAVIRLRMDRRVRSSELNSKLTPVKLCLGTSATPPGAHGESDFWLSFVTPRRSWPPKSPSWLQLAL